MRRRLPRWILKTLCCLFLVLCHIPGAAASGSSRIDITRPDPDGEATRVEVGIWVIDVGSIDSVAQEFDANVFIILKWNDPRLAHEENITKRYALDEIWNPNILLANEGGIVRKSFPETVQVDADGTVTYPQRYLGPFSQPLKLNDFPFDSHTFRIQLAAQGSKAEDIDFVPYSKFVRNGMKGGMGMAKNISLPDWSIEAHAGGPVLYQVAPTLQIAGYQFEFKAKRDTGHFIWKVILPLVLIVCMSWIVFWIDPSRLGTQISLAATSMLTLIAYRFIIDTLVPKVAYMTRLDQFILSGSVLVFLAMIQASFTSRLFALRKTVTAVKIDVWCRALFPLAFIVASLLTLVW